jgi:hypothetical protein
MQVQCKWKIKSLSIVHMNFAMIAAIFTNNTHEWGRYVEHNGFVTITPLVTGVSIEMPYF